MSGLEALGGAAAALQLVETSIKVTSAIVEVYRRRPPENIRHHLDQINVLASTAKSIQKHPYLQTRDVEHHLLSTLKQVQGLKTSLDNIQRQYWKRSALRYLIVLVSIREEEKLVNKLDCLEREKTALIFSVQIAQSSVLGQINNNVQELVDTSWHAMPVSAKDLDWNACNGNGHDHWHNAATQQQNVGSITVTNAKNEGKDGIQNNNVVGNGSFGGVSHKIEGSLSTGDRAIQNNGPVGADAQLGQLESQERRAK